MSRLAGVSPRGTSLNEIVHDDFGDLRAARRAQDQKIIAFVHDLSEEQFAEPLEYVTTSGVPYFSRSIRCSPICSTIRRTTEVRRIT